MIASTHTFRFSVDQGTRTLLYSPLTGCIDLIDTKSLATLDAALKTSDTGEISPESLTYLERRGHLYKTSEDATAALARGYDEFIARESKSNIRFVMIPTYQCNSRCPYCFIGDTIGEEKLMGDEVMDLAFAAVDELSKRHDPACTRQLSLFGGEPLIDSPAQRKVVERILAKASERGLLIDVVSNGFDLEHYATLLKAYGVVKVQVTFDGPKEYHNKRRMAVDRRGPSFDRIVSGIDAALANDLPVNTRLLLDRNSIDQLPALVQFMKDRGWFDHPAFSTHIGSVFDCFRCQPGKEIAKHLGVVEGNKRLMEICKKDRSIADLLELDWQGIRRFMYTGKLFPATYKTCFGGNRTFAIDLNGGIYACETTAGRPEYKVGEFVPALHMNEEVIQALNDRTILNIPKCKDCGQALLCAGGCTFNAIVNHGALLAPGCRMIKETLQYGLDYYWPEIKAKLVEPQAAEQLTVLSDCCSPTGTA